MLVPLEATAQSNLSIATGGTGGTYYPLGGGIAELINTHVEGYQAVAEATGASEENVALVFQGESDIAFALADTAFQAYSGSGNFEGRPIPSLRALGAVYPNALHLVTLAGSGIETLEDLRSARVSIGAPGSGTAISAEALLSANGISLDELSVQRLDFNETAAALRDGQIDAGFWSAGPPTASILDLATTRDVRLVSLTEAQIAAAQELDPSYAPYTMSAGTYPGQDEEVLALSTPNLLIVDESLDETLVYEVTKTIFEHVDDLIAIHPAANDTTVAFSLASTPIPLHPGAVRYYQEVGADVPEHLIAGE